MFGFAPDTAQAFALKMGLGFAAGGWFVLWAAMQQPGKPLGRWADCYLGTLLGGILGARLFYVLVHLERFADAPLNIPRLWYGGLSWQGAILGGWLALALLCRWRGISARAFGDALALALPAGVMAFSWAARSAGLMIGERVPDLAAEPVWQAAFLPDLARDVAPRYELQMLGLAWGAGLLLILAGVTLTGRLPGRRLGLALLLLAPGVALLAHHSAMPSAALLGVSLDTWGVVGLLGLGLAWLKRRENTPSQPGQDRL